MNIFEHYLLEIKNLVSSNKNDLKLINLDNLKNINLEVPPEHINFDLSCNISLILGQSNKLNPRDLAIQLKSLFEKKIKNFEIIEIAGPGFLNIKLSNSAIINNINSILENDKIYGYNKSNQTYAFFITYLRHTECTQGTFSTMNIVFQC